MIKNLYIKNYAIIKEVSINFEVGLNILTGETGSGKSIIIQTISILLGANFYKKNIRTDEEECIIGGLIRFNNEDFNIKRIINNKGTSKNFLNKRSVTVDKIKQISSYFIDLHGQHDHQKLLNPESHIHYLDSFGNYYNELDSLKYIYDSILMIQEEINDLEKNYNNILEKKELFKFQLNEINQIEIYENIDVELDSDYKLLSNAKEIIENIVFLNDIINNKNEPLLSRIDHFHKKINKFSNISSDLDSIINRLQSIQIDIQDFIEQLNSYSNSIETNNDRLLEISEKIGFIEMLKRKYGGSVESVLNYKKEISYKLKKLNNNKFEIDGLISKKNKLTFQYNKISALLTKKRKETSIIFSNEISSILKNMDMNKVKINFSIQTNTEIINSKLGQDICLINISSNLGEKLRPLHSIISGGELSRIMLAIKVLMKNRQPINSIVFDEIDTGISGKTADKIGILLEDLGQNIQVICITHLSQIASKGDAHFKVHKHSNNNRTEVLVKKLSYNQRINEIAELISGVKLTDASKKQAKELLR